MAKAMLLQVLRLTQDQISQLPPAERDAILALVSLPIEDKINDVTDNYLTSDPNLVILRN